MPASNPISDLPSLFQVRTTWATRHQWRDGEMLEQTHLSGYSFWIIEEGELRVESDSQKWILHRGDAMLWPAGLHRVIRAGASAKSTFAASWLTIGLCAHLFGHLDVMTLLFAPQSWRPKNATFIQLQALMENIVLTTGDNAASKVLLRDGFCRAVVGMLWEMLREDDMLVAASQTLPEWLQKVLVYAQKNPGATVAELTQLAAFSPAQFRRAFAQWMQISPREYLQNQRLQTAGNLLEHTDLSISAIAGELGFASVTHFGKIWKKTRGVSPAAHRRAVRSPHLQV